MLSPDHRLAAEAGLILAGREPGDVFLYEELPYAVEDASEAAARKRYFAERGFELEDDAPLVLVVDNASPDPELRAELKRIADADELIDVIFRTENDVRQNRKVGSLYAACEAAFEHAMARRFEFLHLIQGDFQMLWWDSDLVAKSAEIFAAHPRCVNISMRANLRDTPMWAGDLDSIDYWVMRYRDARKNGIRRLFPRFELRGIDPASRRKLIRSYQYRPSPFQLFVVCPARYAARRLTHFQQTLFIRTGGYTWRHSCARKTSSASL